MSVNKEINLWNSNHVHTEWKIVQGIITCRLAGLSHKSWIRERKSEEYYHHGSAAYGVGSPFLCPGVWPSVYVRSRTVWLMKGKILWSIPMAHGLHLKYDEIRVCCANFSLTVSLIAGQCGWCASGILTLNCCLAFSMRWQSAVRYGSELNWAFHGCSMLYVYFCRHLSLWLQLVLDWLVYWHFLLFYR